MKRIFIKELGLFLTLADLSDADSILSKFGRVAAHKRELGFVAGQSNADGQNPGDPFLPKTEDAPHPRVFEYSRADQSNYFTPPLGGLMVHKMPAQGSTSINFSLSFAKYRASLNPDLREIVILNRGQGGTGFSGNDWNPGDPIFNNLTGLLNDCMRKHPRLKLAFGLWQHGESDVGLIQSAYEAALSAFMNGIRSSVIGAKDLSFFVGTMSEKWIQADEAGRRHIDLAHRNIENYDDNATFVDLSHLGTSDIHYSGPEQRLIGPEYAKKMQVFFQQRGISRYVSHQFEVQDGKIVDKWNDGNVFGSATIAADGTYGDVLDTNGGIGYHTDISLNPAEYTKATWVNLQTIPASGFGSLISGSIDGNIADSHFWGWGGYGHSGASTSVNQGLSSTLVVGTWVHVALVWDGVDFKLYVNGVLDHTGTAATNALTDNQGIEIGTYGGINTDGLDALYHKTTILPFATDALGIAELYNQ